MGMDMDTGNNMDSMGTDDNIQLVEGDIGYLLPCLQRK